MTAGTPSVTSPGARRSSAASSRRRRSADGDEIELISRLAAFDPLEQTMTYEMRARLWRDGPLIREELGALREGLNFVPELRLALETAGFDEITVERGYTGEPATAEDEVAMFVAHASP